MSDTAIEIASGAVTVTTTWSNLAWPNVVLCSSVFFSVGVYAFSIYSWHRLAFLLPFVFGFVGGLIGKTFGVFKNYP